MTPSDLVRRMLGTFDVQDVSGLARLVTDDVRLRHPPFKQLLHHGFGFVARKVAAGPDFVQHFRDQCVT